MFFAADGSTGFLLMVSIHIRFLEEEPEKKSSTAILPLLRGCHTSLAFTLSSSLLIN